MKCGARNADFRIGYKKQKKIESGLRNADMFRTGWKKSNVSYGILACLGFDGKKSSVSYGILACLRLD